MLVVEELTVVMVVVVSILWMSESLVSMMVGVMIMMGC